MSSKLDRARAALCAAALFLTAGGASAQDSAAAGIVKPFVLEPFVADQPQCAAPLDRERSLVFFQDNRREFIEGVGDGLRQAATDRGLDFTAVVANDSGQTMIEQVEAARGARVGAFVVAPVDARSLGPHLRTAIGDGVYVGAVVPPPAVTILNAPQYQTGKKLADDAARYIQAEWGGRANVVLLTHDNLQFLAPRFTAMRDVLSGLPGVTIVADISPSPVSEEGGYETMKTILIAQPQIDVVLGADTVVLGALRALREAGKARPDQYLGGIDACLRLPTSIAMTLILPTPRSSGLTLTGELNTCACMAVFASRRGISSWTLPGPPSLLGSDRTCWSRLPTRVRKASSAR